MSIRLEPNKPEYKKRWITFVWCLVTNIRRVPKKSQQKLKKFVDVIVGELDPARRIDCYFALLLRDVNADLTSVGWTYELLFGEKKKMQVCYLEPVKSKAIQLDGSEKVFTLLDLVNPLTLVLRCVFNRFRITYYHSRSGVRPTQMKNGVGPIQFQ
jgi:hypothetical protein